MHPQAVDFQTSSAPPPPAGVQMPNFQSIHQSDFGAVNGMEMMVNQQAAGQPGRRVPHPHSIQYASYHIGVSAPPLSSPQTVAHYVSSGGGPYVQGQPQYVSTSVAPSHPPAGSIHPPNQQPFTPYTTPHQVGTSQQSVVNSSMYPPASTAAYGPADAISILPMQLSLQPGQIVAAMPQPPYMQEQQQVASPPRPSNSAAAANATSGEPQPTAAPSAVPNTGGAAVGPSMSLEELKMKLQRQLEYYFSRENLAHDEYLRTQMDQDQFVPIWTIASFNQVKKLTNDINLVTQVLRESPNVLVDSEGLKVRPNHTRSTVILREIPDDTEKHEVEALFNHSSCPKIANCELALNNTWYVTFESEMDAMKAYTYLNDDAKFFKGKPIFARIKNNPMNRVSSGPPATPTGGPPGTATPTGPPSSTPVLPGTAIMQPSVTQSRNGAGGRQLPQSTTPTSSNAFPTMAVVSQAPTQQQMVLPGPAAMGTGASGAVTSLMSTTSMTQANYPFGPPQATNALPMAQPNGQLYYQLPHQFYPAAPTNGLMQPAWGYPNGFNQGFGAPNMIQDGGGIFPPGNYKPTGGRGGYQGKPRRGRGGGMSSERSSNDRDMRHQGNYGGNPMYQQGGNSGYAGYGGYRNNRPSWDNGSNSSKKSYHNNTSSNSNYGSSSGHYTNAIPTVTPVASAGGQSTANVGNQGSQQQYYPASVSPHYPLGNAGGHSSSKSSGAAPSQTPIASAASMSKVAAEPEVTAVAATRTSTSTAVAVSTVSSVSSSNSTPLVSVSSTTAAVPQAATPAQAEVSPVTGFGHNTSSQARHSSAPAPSSTGIVSSSKGLGSRGHDDVNSGFVGGHSSGGFYSGHHSKSSMDGKDVSSRRGRGRGGSRGGGRSVTDDGREMGGGGRGGYLGRGGYHQSGGYRGGHGMGGPRERDGGSTTTPHGGDYGHGPHAHGQVSVNVPSANSRLLSAPEFEMKGNDFPALPGSGEVVAPNPRKVSESGGDEGSTPWESNRFLDVVKGTAKMKLSRDGEEAESVTSDCEPPATSSDHQNTLLTSHHNETTGGAKHQSSASPNRDHNSVSAQPSNSSSQHDSNSKSSQESFRSPNSQSESQPQNGVIPTASQNSISALKSGNNVPATSGVPPRSGSHDQQLKPESKVNVEAGGPPIVSITSGQVEENSKHPVKDGKRVSYAQIAQKEAAAFGAGAAESPEGAMVTDSSNADSSKKIVKEQAVKSNFQGVVNGRDSSDQKSSVISPSPQPPSSSNGSSSQVRSIASNNIASSQHPPKNPKGSSGSSSSGSGKTFVNKRRGKSPSTSTVGGGKPAATSNPSGAVQSSSSNSCNSNASAVATSSK